jgi:hypothetical protein
VAFGLEYQIEIRLALTARRADGTVIALDRRVGLGALSHQLRRRGGAKNREGRCGASRPCWHRTREFLWTALALTPDALQENSTPAACAAPI